MGPPDKEMSAETFISKLRGSNDKKGFAYWVKFWPVAVAIVTAISWGIRLEGKADTGAALREAVIENSKYRVAQTSPDLIKLRDENRKQILDTYATDKEMAAADKAVLATCIAKIKARH